MSWASSRTQRPWRDFLTDDEAVEIAGLERQRLAAKHRLAEISARLYSIQNRATLRSKYQPKP